MLNLTKGHRTHIFYRCTGSAPAVQLTLCDFIATPDGFLGRGIRAYDLCFSGS